MSAATPAPPAPPPRPSPGRLLLWLVGGGQLALYATVAALSPRFAYGAEDRPILTVVGLFVSATVGWLAAVGWGWAQTAASPPRLKIILGFAVLHRLVLLPSQPILEVDFYRYLWDGRATAGGFNPYHYSPWQVREAGSDTPPELAALARLGRQSPAVRTALERTHYPDVPTIYPPAAQAVFAAAAWLTPADWPLAAHVLVLKSLLVLFDLGTIAVLVILLRRLALPTAWCLGYAWCPLVLKEVANSGHLDSIAVFFTTLGLCLLAVRPSLTGACGGLAALGVGVLAKSYPVVMLPVVAAFLLARFRAAAAIPLLVFAGVVAGGYLPFLAGLPAADADNPAAHPGSGLREFLTRWEANDFLFMLVHDNLRVSEEAPRHVVVPRAWRETLHRDYFEPWRDALGLSFKADPSFAAAQGVVGLGLLAIVLAAAWQAYRRPGPTTLLQGTFRAVAWAWLLGSAANPWYLLWGLPLMAFDGRRSWYLLPALVWLYYVRFWVDGLPWDQRPVAPDDLVWVEYVPFYAALAVESWRKPWAYSFD